MVSRGLATALTSTTAAVCSNRFRRVQTNRPKQADRSQSATAHSLSPVVPHQGSGPSKDSKLDPNAHQPHTKSGDDKDEEQCEEGDHRGAAAR